jgi:hypothetical protein
MLSVGERCGGTAEPVGPASGAGPCHGRRSTADYRAAGCIWPRHHARTRHRNGISRNILARPGRLGATTFQARTRTIGICIDIADQDTAETGPAGPGRPLFIELPMPSQSPSGPAHDIAMTLRSPLSHGSAEGPGEQPPAAAAADAPSRGPARVGSAAGDSPSLCTSAQPGGALCRPLRSLGACEQARPCVCICPSGKQSMRKAEPSPRVVSHCRHSHVGLEQGHRVQLGALAPHRHVFGVGGVRRARTVGRADVRAGPVGLAVGVVEDEARDGGEEGSVVEQRGALLQHLPHGPPAPPHAPHAPHKRQ